MIDDDTRDKLARRAQELLAVFLDETNVEAWPSTETASGRGDRVWMKKNATQTIALVEQIRGLLMREAGVAPPPEAPEDDTARLVREAEAAAAAILKRSATDTPH